MVSNEALHVIVRQVIGNVLTSLFDKGFMFRTFEILFHLRKNRPGFPWSSKVSDVKNDICQRLVLVPLFNYILLKDIIVIRKNLFALVFNIAGVQSVELTVASTTTLWLENINTTHSTNSNEWIKDFRNKILNFWIQFDPT